MDKFIDDSDHDENEHLDETLKGDMIDGLGVRRDALNKQLNGSFRM